MAEEIGSEYGEAIASITLVPSHGGVFVVTCEGEEVYAKAKTGRFPEAGEIGRLIAPRISD